MLRNFCTILLSFAVILFFFNASFPNVCAKNNNFLYVGGNGDGNFSNIQNAINSSIKGDTIFIYNGTYKENLFINKSINLVGENKNNTIFNATGKNYCIFVSSENVSISGLSIKNSSIGVYISPKKEHNNIFINDMIFYNNTGGILLDDSSNYVYIYNNIFKNNSEGIRLYNSSKNFINNNYFEKNRACLKFYDKSKNNLISNNSFFESGLCINLERWSNNNKIEGNNISNGDHGIYLYLCSNIEIKDNMILNNSARGIFIKDSKNITISNNSIIKNGYYGLYIDNFEDYNMTEIEENNIFIDNEQDIQIKPKPPVIKIPSLEITLVIILVILSMLVFFLKIRHDKNK